MGAVNFFKFHSYGVHIPMQALVDYHGFRLIAMPVLPISNGGSAAPSTIVYGSGDAGANIHMTDEYFNIIMEETARELHICGHSVQGKHIHFRYACMYPWHSCVLFVLSCPHPFLCPSLPPSLPPSTPSLPFIPPPFTHT